MFCEVASKVVQGLSQIPFYNKNKTFLLIHFLPMFLSHAPRKHQKTSDGGIGGFKWNVGCKWVK